MPPEDRLDPRQNFLEEQIHAERSEVRRLPVRMTVRFAALFGFVFCLLVVRIRHPLRRRAGER